MIHIDIIHTVYTTRSYDMEYKLKQEEDIANVYSELHVENIEVRFYLRPRSNR